MNTTTSLYSEVQCIKKQRLQPGVCVHFGEGLQVQSRQVYCPGFGSFPRCPHLANCLHLASASFALCSSPLLSLQFPSSLRHHAARIWMQPFWRQRLLLFQGLQEPSLPRVWGTLSPQWRKLLSLGSFCGDVCAMSLMPVAPGVLSGAAADASSHKHLNARVLCLQSSPDIERI